ncbi:MAG: GNAT family N-acetyltransferase [Lachnospiraceae bacterium]|nr:GNAT family N-acetyltransferase [Lachnospiraceae bacterium]
MQITRITKENEKMFQPLFIKAMRKASPGIIRLGVIDDQDVPCGALAARTIGKSIDMASLYVYRGHRRQGAGTALIGALEELASDTGYITLNAEFLEGEDAVGFYKAMGFELFPYGEQYYITLGEFTRSPLYKRFIGSRNPDKVRLMSSLSSAELKAVSSHIGNVGYDPQLSTVRFVKGEYSSCLLIRRIGRNISVVWLNSVLGIPTELLYHMNAAVKSIRAEFEDADDVPIRMIFEKSKIHESFVRLLGGNQHIHREGSLIDAIKLL